MTIAVIDTARISSCSDDTAKDKALIALVQKVTVRGDDRLTEMHARVVAILEDGSGAVLFYDLDLPLSNDVRASRLTQKARAIIGRALADDLWAAVHAPRAGDLNQLLNC